VSDARGVESGSALLSDRLLSRGLAIARKHQGRNRHADVRLANRSIGNERLSMCKREVAVHLDVPLKGRVALEAQSAAGGRNHGDGLSDGDRVSLNRVQPVSWRKSRPLTGGDL